MDQTNSKIPATSRTPTSSVRGLGKASNIPANTGCNHWRNPPSTVTAGAFAEAALTETDGLASGVEDSFADAAFGRAEPVSDGAKTGVASAVGIEVGLRFAWRRLGRVARRRISRCSTCTHRPR